MSQERHYRVSVVGAGPEYDTVIRASSARRAKYLRILESDTLGYIDVRARLCDAPIDHEQLACDAWNATNPVGTPVRYWTSVREGDGVRGETTTTAQMQSSGHAVVWVSTCSGWIVLTHVEVIDDHVDTFDDEGRRIPF